MKSKKIYLVVAATVFLTIVQARDPYERQPGIDIQHYAFRVELNDSTDRIVGEASVTVLFRSTATRFFLDFGGRTKGEGMKVMRVSSGNASVPFVHKGERLSLNLPSPAAEGQTQTFTIAYQGIPEDGLVIGRNKFGDRTFFADHWPDRGHLWLPSIDHPSDKATVEFTVIAPDHYHVVASGLKQEESSLPGKRKLTRYKESVPIALKITAVGVARFAVEDSGLVDGIPQSTWVYPQNKDEGFDDFAVGMKVFTFYNRSIGPYPYEKLAHVQSKTRWGGLENAGNIFYNEKTVTGKNTAEGLIAHEVAHQWFGDGVTESDWHHVWLSEGFATYFADLYMESAYGPERLKQEMREQRESVLEYYKINPNPVVDTTIVEIGKVLSINTYAKAGWVLHMLRRQIGDEAFWKGIRDYYDRFKNRNALTSDLRVAIERASQQDLTPFFNQWLYRGGHPNLAVSWQQKGTNLRVEIAQQGTPFRFPLLIRLILADGSTWDRQLQINEGRIVFDLTPPGKVVSVTLDPDVNLLFEGSVRGK